MMRLFLLLVLCSIAPVARAQTFLSLDSCRTLALAHNTRAKAAQAQVEKMQYETNAYHANFFPRISLQGMYLLSSGEFDYRNHYDLYNTPIPALVGMLPPVSGLDNAFLDRLYRSIALDLDITVKPHNTYMAGIRFEQPVFMGGKITTAYRMAQIGKQMAQLNLMRSREELVLQTDRAYWEYVKTLELYRTALAYRDAVGQVCNDAQNGVETGLLPENDRLKAQVRLGEAGLLLRQAENGRRLAQINLCMTVGLPLLTPVAPLDSLPDTAAARRLETTPDVTARTEYALLNKQIELQRQQINLARSAFLPQIGITGGYMYLNGMTFNGGKLLDEASFSALVSFSVPITQWSEGVHRIRAARADLRIAEYRMQETLERLFLEIVKTENTLDEAALQTAIARDEYAQAAENLRIRHDRYEVGLESLASLLEAQALWQQASSRYIEAKAALRIAETDYLRVTGQLEIKN
ncbi:MAG: TolC family protein [Prevotellaceae bacterium]|jgi:outer membrane protein TolC|nr:TolC family protein [Prevotellaceae bacterium]